MPPLHPHKEDSSRHDSPRHISRRTTLQDGVWIDPSQRSAISGRIVDPVSFSPHENWPLINVPRQASISVPYSPESRYLVDLSRSVINFMAQKKPRQTERNAKEEVRAILEQLIQKNLEPQSGLQFFGSTANGFDLQNSDVDICCFMRSTRRLPAIRLIESLASLLTTKTKFDVKARSHTRIPSIKLSIGPSDALPLGIECDITFENRLSVENTRLLQHYRQIDPDRVGPIVLFVKFWAKQRQINSPDSGTLSSYGYILLVIYFLVHISSPPVLPNLQKMPVPGAATGRTTDGYNTWFCDGDMSYWRSGNHQTVGQLLSDLFDYYAREFFYGEGIVSLPRGLLRKSVKGWEHDFPIGRFGDQRIWNEFCIEDPFLFDFNVAQCVTDEGLELIRKEFQRAADIFKGSTHPPVSIPDVVCEPRSTSPTPQSEEQNIITAMLREEEEDSRQNLTASIRNLETVSFAKGGFSDIHKAQLVKSEGITVPVAVKILRVRGRTTDPVTSANLRRKLNREARLWSDLNHENVLTFLGLYHHELGLSHGLVSPYCNLGDVMSYLEDCPDADRRSLVIGITKGLVYLHQKDVVHGDLKGENVLVYDGDNNVPIPCLCDFGISKILNQSGFTTAFSGTPAFMAPELFISDADIESDNFQPVTTKKSDVYAYGLVVLQVLTRQGPTPPLHSLVTREQRRKPGRERYDPDYKMDDRLWALLDDCFSRDSNSRPDIYEVLRRVVTVPL